METRLLGYERAATVNEIALWGNNLLGKEAPGSPGYIVVKVIQFQVLANGNGYDGMLLVEVTERPIDTQVSLRAADIAVIEELTSSVDETA